jgi:hypothetical protein
MSLTTTIKCVVTSLLIASVSAIAKPTNQALISWGYKLTNQLTYSDTLCTKSIVLSRQLTGIKSLKPVEAEENTFYRFTLGAERFASVADQQKRLDELNNPETGNSLISKSCNLIEFFSCNHQIYFVHTDSLMFASELNRIKDLYQRETCVESEF